MICGAFMPDGISPFLKVYITSQTTMVVGYIGEGSSMSIESMWESPFSNDSLGGVAGAITAAAGKLADGAQAVSGNTSKSDFNSLLIWEGQQPPEFNITVDFRATVNAKIEVMDAIMALQQMASPELNAVTPGGRRPSPVILDIGRRIKLMDIVIRSVSVPVDVPKTQEGYFLRNTVTLQCSGMSVQNQSDIPFMYI